MVTDLKVGKVLLCMLCEIVWPAGSWHVALNRHGLHKNTWLCHITPDSSFALSKYTQGRLTLLKQPLHQHSLSLGSDFPTLALSKPLLPLGWPQPHSTAVAPGRQCPRWSHTCPKQEAPGQPQSCLPALCLSYRNQVATLTHCWKHCFFSHLLHDLPQETLKTSMTYGRACGLDLDWHL